MVIISAERSNDVAAEKLLNEIQDQEKVEEEKKEEPDVQMKNKNT